MENLTNSAIAAVQVEKHFQDSACSLYNLKKGSTVHVHLVFLVLFFPSWATFPPGELSPENKFKNDVRYSVTSSCKSISLLSV